MCFFTKFNKFFWQRKAEIRAELVLNHWSVCKMNKQAAKWFNKRTSSFELGTWTSSFELGTGICSFELGTWTSSFELGTETSSCEQTPKNSYRKWKRLLSCQNPKFFNSFNFPLWLFPFVNVLLAAVAKISQISFSLSIRLSSHAIHFLLLIPMPFLNVSQAALNSL